MIRKLSTFVLFLIITSEINAQILSSFNIGVSGGLSIPLNDFGDNDPTSSKSGFATKGYKLEASISTKLVQTMDVGLMFFATSNGTDLDNYIEQLNKQNSLNSFSADSKQWVITGGFAGLTYSIPIQESLFLDARVYAGMITFDSPQILLATNKVDSYLKISKTEVSSFAYLGSLGIRIPINRTFHLTISADYLSSNPNFENVNETLSISGKLTQKTNKFKQQMNILAFSVGTKIFLQ